MRSMQLDDTIVAISTPIGEGGIGIVRLSGKDALAIVDRIFLPKNGKKLSEFETYTVHYGHIIERDEGGNRFLKEPVSSAGKREAREERIIDEVILTIMRAPRSYTKEDIVEINCHSGIAPLRKILDLVLANGARLAQPGEFTKRAFLNGRIDINQAESVLDIIRAKTDLSLKAAVNNLDGLFSKKIKSLRDELMNIFAHIEASIDFSEEEDVDIARRKDILERIRRVKKEIQKLISTAHEGKILRQGVRAVICGSPNVGKSSLMNAILKESRVIVTDIPGTTRDTVEENVNIKGLSVVLIDTAGISNSGKLIEKEGIKRSQLSIQSADLVLLVLDYGRKLNRNDLDIIHKVKDREVILVINKYDIKRCIDIRQLRKFFPKNTTIYVSALNSTGIDKLENAIYDTIFKGKAPTADFVSISNDRQLGILRCSLKEINEAIVGLENKFSMDCISLYIRSSVESMGEITGDTITEEALNKIFSEFCIGK